MGQAERALGDLLCRWERADVLRMPVVEAYEEVCQVLMMSNDEHRCPGCGAPTCRKERKDVADA